MNQVQINKQIFRRIERLEKKVFNRDTKSDHGGKEQKADSKVSLPNLILKLRDSGFFKQPQSVSDVYKKLSPAYPCSIDRVDTALRRLKERKKLRITNKIIKGKEVLAYV
mgnify:CR=1 FL=1